MKSSIEFIRILAVILIAFTYTRNNLTEGFTYYLFEIITTYGTAVLSIISGYLYFEITRKKEHLFWNKCKSLALPYLIANVSILILVLFCNYVLGYNALNRLTYDYTLITEGVLLLTVHRSIR